jgi:hypothetical protein
MSKYNADNPIRQPTSVVSPICCPLMGKEFQNEISYAFFSHLCVCGWFLLLLTDGVDFYTYSDILYFILYDFYKSKLHTTWKSILYFYICYLFKFGGF